MTQRGSELGNRLWSMKFGTMLTSESCMSNDKHCKHPESTENSRISSLCWFQPPDWGLELVPSLLFLAVALSDWSRERSDYVHEALRQRWHCEWVTPRLLLPELIDLEENKEMLSSVCCSSVIYGWSQVETKKVNKKACCRWWSLLIRLVWISCCVMIDRWVTAAQNLVPLLLSRLPHSGRKCPGGHLYFWTVGSLQPSELAVTILAAWAKISWMSWVRWESLQQLPTHLNVIDVKWGQTGLFIVKSHSTASFPKSKKPQNNTT